MTITKFLSRVWSAVMFIGLLFVGVMFINAGLGGHLSISNCLMVAIGIDAVSLGVVYLVMDSIKHSGEDESRSDTVGTPIPDSPGRAYAVSPES